MSIAKFLGKNTQITLNGQKNWAHNNDYNMLQFT